MRWWMRVMMAVEQIRAEDYDPPVIEVIEAEAREQMAKVARMQVRGFDTAQAKARETRVLDGLLDQYNACRRIGR
jgi:hypothetical protein